MTTRNNNLGQSGSPAASGHFALYSSSLGNYFYDEIRDLIAAGLQELGLKVEIRNEQKGFAPRADWHLIVAPYEFFELGAGKALAAGNWPKNLILLNSDQPSTSWLAQCLKHFDRASVIWDIDFDSALRIGKRGYVCDYLPLGQAAGSALFQKVDQLPLIEETRHLSPAVRAQSGFAASFETRPIDLLFLGHASPRRERYFARHAGRLKKFNCFFHKPALVGALITGQTTNMNTLVSVGLSQRSKILLNIHHGVDRYFEWHRIVLLGIAQRTLVVTEPCSIAPPFRANLDYVEAPLDELPERIEYYLESAAGRAEGQRIVDHGFATLTAQCRLSDRLRPLVEQLQSHGKNRVSPGARYFPVKSPETKPAASLSLCVVTPVVAGEGPEADAGSAQVALAESLVEIGHQVTLLQTEGTYGENFSASYWRKYFAARGIDYVLLPASAQIPLEATPPCTRSYEAYLWLKEGTFAAVHLPETQGIGFYSLLARRQGLAFSNTRFCLHAHGPRVWRRHASQQFLNQPAELEFDFLERECFRRADALTASTRCLREWLEQQKWSMPGQCQSLPRLVAVPVAARANASIPIQEVVYLGPLTESPGLALFCNAVEQVSAVGLREASVVFMDDSTMAPSPRTLASLYDRARRWTFKWRITRVGTELHPAAESQEARLMVLPGPQENAPYNLSRCLSLGLPLLAANTPTLAELLHPEDHSRVLFESKPAALVAALKRAVEKGLAPARAVDQTESRQAWLAWHAEWAARTHPAAPKEAEPPPLVSVCLIHFNRPQFLNQALDSLRAQDYTNFEVVLVDDGSSDPAALNMLRNLEPEFKKRQWQIVRQENRYLGAARNNGARHARGEYLIFMDDDNFAKPNQISTFVKVARATGADTVTSAMDLFTGTAPPQPGQKPWARWIFLGGAPATGVFRNCFGDANACTRRDTFLRLGGFTEDYGITHEDWEFHARATLQGCHVETTPEALFYYRMTDHSMIRSTPRYANHQRYLRPYLEAIPAALHDLVNLLQGSVLFPPEKTMAQPDLENLVRLNRRLVAIAKELIPAGQVPAAEAIFLEILNSASATQQPALVLQTLLDIGSALVEKDCGAMAETILVRAEQVARARHDDASVKEAAALLASARKLAAAKKAPLQLPAAANRQFSPPPALASSSRHEGETPTPLVSVIIPVLNNLALTQGCLESIRQTQNSGILEIIVVDNASTDGTAEFIKAEQAAGRIRSISNNKNLGFARACNQGAEAARGSLVVFLNNDTRVTPGWAEAMAQAARRPDVGIVGARLLYADGHIQHAGIEFINGVPDHPHRRAAADAPEVTQFRELDMVTGACFLMHRELCLQLAGFDESYQNGVEDIDLCLRVRAAGRKVVYEPKAVVYHLEGQSKGRFDHVSENLKLFFDRWKGCFDANNRFLVPQTPKLIASDRSALLPKAGDGKMSESGPITVDWVGSFLDNGSLSHVNRALTGALSANRDLRVRRITNGAQASKGYETLAKEVCTTASPDVAATIRHAWPPDWRRPDQGKLVVIQPWEFGLLPQDWVSQASQVDEFWVPSNFVRDSFTASGIPAQKVFVVPNGVEVATFHPRVAPLALATQKKFKFLFVGGTIGRKGPDLLLNAYLQTFTSADDVCLVIKDFGGKSFYAGQTFEAQIRAAQAIPNAAEILYLNEELPPKALPGLYTACDCFVLPYRGEGFGLPVLEAMACGLPVIVTSGGATDDFVRDEFAWRIPAARNFIGDTVGGLKLVGNGWLLEPDPQKIGMSMRQAIGDPAGARARGSLASRHAHENFSWKHSATIVAERLRKLTAGGTGVSQLPPAKPAQRRLPPVTLIGQLHEARKLLGLKKHREAWESAVAAIRRRPFHPEAFFLLAEIALAAGDGTAARECAQRARELVPSWNPVRQFLNKPLRGNLKQEWLKLPEKNPRRLSICLIVKNEETFLNQCLESVRSLGAQIVVVDTGSTDCTREIAKQHGAEVYEFAWQQDFASARNAALAHARGDWVLMLDADEELTPDQHAHLIADMGQTKALGCRLPLVNREREANGRSFVPRLFRNVPGIFYTGRIHEQLFPSLMTPAKTWGMELLLGTAQLLHHGYTKQMVQDRDKIRRNLELLRLAVAENPADANLMMNLGLELVRSEDLAGGVEKYREAFKLMTAGREDETAPELREVLLTQFTSQLYKLRAHEEVVEVLNSPLARKGGLTASLHFALGLALFELKQFAAAAEQMRLCLNRRHLPGLAPINTDILSAAPEHCQALCLDKLGNAAGAEKSFLAALSGENQTAANLADVKLDYAKFLAAQNRAVEAFHKLHELVAANSRQLSAWQTGAEIALGHPDFLEFAGNWTAEAMRYVAEDFTINRQRAETLMLNGDTETAVPMWERLWNSERQPMILAALILCETVESLTRHTPDHIVDEPATSRAFIKWYQRLIAMRAYPVVQRLNARLENLSHTLPTAAAMLHKALAEPAQPTR